jgi:exopolyphosphatase/guanosine-5'-triphosphate,3'-diphosphate pyrophosphatase
MVEVVKSELRAFHHADSMRPVFEAGRAHLIGTSGRHHQPGGDCT